MESLQEIRTYEEFKAAADREVYNQAQGFVRLGYLLRRAEDTDILRESGYRTVTEFAKAEYGLTETYVSRYIAINRRYSEGGYSDRLQGRFEGFGMAKLADMLTIPDGVAEVIPAEATRTEIQEIKREVVMEQQISDLEVLAEQRDCQEEDLLTGMLREYYRTPEAWEEYRQVYAAIRQQEAERKNDLYRAMAPADTAAKMARVAGAGRMLLTIRSLDQNPELMNIRSGEKRSYAWEELFDRLEGLFGGEDTPEQSWEEVYKAPCPKPDEPESARKKAVVGIAKPDPEKICPQKITENREEEETVRKEAVSTEKEEESRQAEKSEFAPVQESSIGEGEAGKPDEGEPDHPDQEETGPAPAKEPDPALEKTKEPVKPEGQQGDRKAETIARMKQEAAEQAEEILKAIKKNYYNMAKMGAKKLLGQLEAIRRELERKEVPGQLEFDTVKEQKRGEA